MQDQAEVPVSQDKFQGWRWDVLGCIFALAYALPSLALPFGRDQGVFWYVGRIWREGGLPYVDAVDHKPPAIYGVYYLSQSLFGEDTWSIHALEWMAIVPLSYVIVRAAGLGKSGRKGALGLASLLFCALYFQSLGFWGTGQAEFWEGLFLLLGLIFAQKGRSLLCGLSLSQACLFKLTAVIPGLLPFGLLLAQSLRRPAGSKRHLLHSIGFFFLGGFGLVCLWLLPFLKEGELWRVWETVVEFNLEYAGRDNANTGNVEETIKAFYPLIPLWFGLGLFCFALGYRRLALRQTGVLSLLFALCVVSVGIQGRWYLYHWVVCIPTLVALMLTLLAEARSLSGGRSFLVGVLMLALAWFGGGGWLGSLMTYSWHANQTWRFLVDKSVDRVGFLYPYSGPRFYRPAKVYEVASFVKESMSPGYSVCAEGFEPVFYVHSGARCPSPFFAVHLLREGKVSERWDHWRARHQDAMEGFPPDVIIRSHVQVEALDVPPTSDKPYDYLYSQGKYSVFRLRNSPYAR